MKSIGLLFAGLVAGAIGSSFVWMLIVEPAAPSLVPTPAPNSADAATTAELEDARVEIAKLEREIESMVSDLAAARRTTRAATAAAESQSDEWSERDSKDESNERGGAAPAEGWDKPFGEDHSGTTDAMGGESARQLTQEEILEMLKSGDPRDRIAALRALPLIEDQELATRLAREQLTADGPPWQRLQAMETLSQVAGAGAISDIAPLLASETDWLARAAARKLGTFGDPTALPALRQAYDTTTNESLKFETALAMRGLGEPGPVIDLSTIAVGDLASNDGNLRTKALRTLSTLGGEENNHYFVMSLADDNSEVRRAAVNALAATGTSSDIPALRLLANDPVADVARAAENAIMVIENPQTRRQTERGFEGRFGR